MPKNCSAFPSTRWSIVLTVREGRSAVDSRKALEELCRVYWGPLYAYARRVGHLQPDAEDATQSFFALILERDILASADESLGRLRSYLIGAFNRHLSNIQRHDDAIKRGGAHTIVSLEEMMEAERRYQNEPSHNVTPALLYEQRCAVEFIRAALKKLAEEQALAGKGPQFELFRPSLDPMTEGHDNQALLAEQIGMSHEAIRVTLHRLRVRFRAILRDLVADTLRNPTPESVDEELRAMLEALSNKG